MKKIKWSYLYLAIVFLLLYLPIFYLIFYSFNDGGTMNSLLVLRGKIIKQFLTIHV